MNEELHQKETIIQVMMQLLNIQNSVEDHNHIYNKHVVNLVSHLTHLNQDSLDRVRAIYASSFPKLKANPEMQRLIYVWGPNKGLPKDFVL